MKPLRLSFLTTLIAALWGATAHAQTTPGDNADSRYIQRAGDRYLDFAGSNANLESLARGLRHGTLVTLSEGPTSVDFVPSTRPMGYGNITRALDLASRQLAAAGVTSPTPEQVRASMIGGTISTPSGDVTLQGVLQLRSQGMGWGQIAHAIGVHPGMGKSPSVTTPVPASGITTAAGKSTTVVSAKSKGSSAAAPVARGHSGIVTGAGAGAAHGQGHGNAFGRGGKP